MCPITHAFDSTSSGLATGKNSLKLEMSFPAPRPALGTGEGSFTQILKIFETKRLKEPPKEGIAALGAVIIDLM